MKKRLLLLLLCLTLLLTSCAAGKEQMPVFRIYGLSDTPGSDAISAVTMDWSGQKSLTVDQQAQAALEQLLGGCTEPGYRSPIPQGVQLRSCQLTGGMALVDFSQGYEQLSGIDLTMADYCVTLTLSQLPGVSVVRITVEGQELAYRSHSLLRSQDLLMTSEDDVSRTLAIRLYFPAQSTGQLTPESRTLTLHEGDSSAEAIVSALLAGPQADGLSPLLPDGFQVLTVRVESGTCYLNLPRSDVSLLPEGQDAQELLVRGMVNSLCSIASVDRVQLLLDGEVAASLGQIDSAALYVRSSPVISKKNVPPAGGTFFSAILLVVLVVLGIGQVAEVKLQLFAAFGAADLTAVQGILVENDFFLADGAGGLEVGLIVIVVLLVLVILVIHLVEGLLHVG